MERARGPLVPQPFGSALRRRRPPQIVKIVKIDKSQRRVVGTAATTTADGTVEGFDDRRHPLCRPIHRRAATRHAGISRETGHDGRYLGTFSSR
jgi:hypothetical protein